MLRKLAYRTGRRDALKKFGAEMLQQPDMMADLRQRSNVDMAWGELANLGDPSNGNPGFSNPMLPLTTGNLGHWHNWQAHAGESGSSDASPGKVAAAVPPGKLPGMAPPPAPPKAIGTAATQMPATPPKPVQLPKLPTFQAPKFTAPPPVPPALPPSPVKPIQQGMLGQQTQTQVANHQKIGEFNFGLHAKPKLPPGRIQPDNGTRDIPSSLDLPRNGSTQAVSRAFNNLRTGPKNQDFLNELNEGYIGATCGG